MPPRKFLARNGWLIAIAAAYLYVFPYFPGIRSANELPRIYLVQAIAVDHTFAIDRGVARWGATADVSPYGGHVYSNKAPGSSMLAAPAYLAATAIDGEPELATAFWLCRFVAGIVPMLLFLVWMWRFLERYAPDPHIRQLVLIAYALGSMAMTSSILFYSHQLGAICVAGSWMLATDVVERKRRVRMMLLAGALAGAAPLVDYQAAFAAVPVAAYVLLRMWRWPRGELVRVVALGLAGAAIPIAILLAYHDACFDSPWRTGYDASTTFAHFHRQGLLGITELRWSAFYGSTVRVDNGLFALMPWLALALPGLFVLIRRDLGSALLIAAVTAIYLLFISSINFWRGGWSIGPRYITALLPFLLPAVTAVVHALRARPLALGFACGPIVVGVAVYALSSATFPYWPDTLRNPLYDVTFRLISEDLVAPNIAGALGVAGVLGIAPYVGLVAGLLAGAITRAAGWRGLAVATIAGAAMLMAYGEIGHGGRGAEHPYRFVRSVMLEP